SVSTVDEVTESEEPSFDPHADAAGEGLGTGPDPGPDDAEHRGRRPRTRKGRTMVLDIISAVLFFLGALLSLAAAVGLARFGDLLSRMHASAKPQVLGLILIAVAIAIQFPTWATVTTLAIIISFQLVTIPV